MFRIAPISLLLLVAGLLLAAGNARAQDDVDGQTAPVFAQPGGAGRWHEYFVLIQSAGHQPFYVRMRGQLLSSSAGGHLILSRLKDSVYRITIGFPKQLFPEQDFNFVIDKKDLGFDLRYLDGRGWVLYNIQTQETEMPSHADTIAVSAPLEGVKKDNAFARLMAGVVSDTAVMYNTYAMEADLKDSAGLTVRDSLRTITRDSLRPIARDSSGSLSRNRTVPLTRDSSGSLSRDRAVPVPPDSSARSSIPRSDSALAPATLPARKPDSSIALSVPAPKSEPIVLQSDSSLYKSDSSLHRPTSLHPKPDSSVSARTPSLHKTNRSLKPAHIEKLSEHQTPAGLRLAYADHTHAHRTDTINIIIPIDTISTDSRLTPTDPHLTPTDPHLNPNDPHLMPTERHLTPTDSHQTSGKSRPADSPPSPASIDSTRIVIVGGQDPPKRKMKPVVVNSDCRNFATDADVDKLKTILMTLPTDAARIAAAKKVFKIKCFSTSQLQALIIAFIGEAAKYNFLENAYPFVSDDRFGELTALFTDPVYIARFKTLVGINGQ